MQAYSLKFIFNVGIKCLTRKFSKCMLNESLENPDIFRARDVVYCLARCKAEFPLTLCHNLCHWRHCHIVTLAAQIEQHCTKFWLLHCTMCKKNAQCAEFDFNAVSLQSMTLQQSCKLQQRWLKVNQLEFFANIFLLIFFSFTIFFLPIFFSDVVEGESA